jgi:nucleotide-binding universal stress UspA family protein
VRVLVYADAGASGDTTLEWLAVLASTLSVDATLLMAYDRVASGVTQLEPVIQFMRSHGGTARVETTDSARASSAIVSAARRSAYDLIILPSSLRGGARGLLRGSRLSAVVRNVGSSILIAHAPARPPQRILVCVGGGPHSTIDAEVAARVAKAFGAQVNILHILSQVPLVYSGIEDLRVNVKHFLASTAPAARQLETAQAILQDQGVSHELRLREGIVVDQIMEEIRDGGYDLLVIGAHERGGGALLQFFLEDLSEDLSQRSPISTLIVQGPESWRGGAT